MSRGGYPLLILSLLPFAGCRSDAEPVARPPEPVSASGAASDPTSDSVKSDWTFRWPASGTAEVRETRRRAGSTAESQFALRWQTRDDGNVEVVMHDVRMLEVDGRPVRASESEQILAKAGFSAALEVHMLIGPDGRLLEILNLDALMNPMLARLKDADLDPAEIEEISASAKSEQTRTIMTQSLSRYWYGWVEAYVGLQATPGEVRDYEEEFTAPGLGLQRCTVHLQAKESGPSRADGWIHLSLVKEFDPETLRKSLLSFPAGTRHVQELQKEAEREMESIRRTYSAECLIDPATLMPHRVLLKDETVLTARDGQETSKKDQWLHVFTWNVTGTGD